MLWEACPECDSLEISERINHHDESLIEFQCRDCGVDWVDFNYET